MVKPSIYRKRYIPFEISDISGDELLYRDKNLLVTRWKPIRPRMDISGGISCAFLEDGYKIGRFFKPDGEFAYWYCDIIDIEYDCAKDTYTLVDLIVDIKVMPDGRYEVLDAGELADAMESGLITKEQACGALRKLDTVLKMIYRNEFPPVVCKNYLKKE